jgi:hypothetical protein
MFRSKQHFWRRQMSKKTQNSKDLADFFKPVQMGLSMNPFLSPQIEHFWNAQEKMLDAAELYSRHWFQRRHEAARTALGAARSMTSGNAGSPEEMMRSIVAWQLHSMERLAEDAREWLDFVSVSTGQFSREETKAVSEGMDKANKLTRGAAQEAESVPV